MVKMTTLAPYTNLPLSLPLERRTFDPLQEDTNHLTLEGHAGMNCSLLVVTRFLEFRQPSKLWNPLASFFAALSF